MAGDSVPVTRGTYRGKGGKSKFFGRALTIAPGIFRRFPRDAEKATGKGEKKERGLSPSEEEEEDVRWMKGFGMILGRGGRKKELTEGAFHVSIQSFLNKRAGKSRRQP